jgi:hypothetical protein
MFPLESERIEPLPAELKTLPAAFCSEVTTPEVEIFLIGEPPKLR